MWDKHCFFDSLMKLFYILQVAPPENCILMQKLIYLLWIKKDGGKDENLRLRRLIKVHSCCYTGMRRTGSCTTILLLVQEAER
jgi:hypothetical protein